MSIEKAVPRQVLATQTMSSGTVDSRSEPGLPTSSLRVPPAWLKAYQMNATAISGSTHARMTMAPTHAVGT